MADTPKMPSAEGPICAKCNLYADCRGKGCDRAHCPSCCPSEMPSDTDRAFDVNRKITVKEEPGG